VVGIASGRSTQRDIEPHDRSTRLAVTRTDLALERSVMAAERTLMAWIRTSLAMISFGFTMGKLGDALDSAKVDLIFGRTTDIVGVAYYLVIIGTLSLIIAGAQYKVETAALARQGVHGRFSLAFFIAVLLSLLGIFVFTDLVLRL
jgi:putative membrane protein